MAAGKQKKRLINSTNPEQYRPGKKPKFHSSNCLISLKSQIGLKWDDYQKRVVPKKEQVGILWSDLAPFIESSQKHCSGLADITYVPPETFSLENLRGVLSYEVWATCLTEAERKFLIQFLPSESVAEENVHLLLTGKNHHFGNPSLSWFSSLCYGDIHPDAVLKKEKQVRADEKAHRINLRNYHSNMVETLKKWRKRWLGCDDPEILFRDNPVKQKQGDIRSKSTKSEMPLKVAQIGDVSKFMSYIEISRTQHNLVKSLKQSGDGIQTKHLIRVIGDLDKFHVKPYGTLMEDEQRKLREHWLNISCNDLPAAFEARRDKMMLIEKFRKLLGLELGEKNVSVLKKADRLADITKEVGQHGACENDDNPDLHNDKVEHSPQDVLQGGNDYSPSLQDRDDEETKCMETSIDHRDSLNVKDEDVMVVNGRGITSQSENSDVQDQDHDDIDIICADTAITFCANNPDGQNEDLMDNPDEQNEDLMDMKFSNDAPDVQVENIKEISYSDTAINDHSQESQQIKSISYTGTSVHNLDSKSMQAQDLEGISCTGLSIHAHEQDQGLKSISYTIMNDDGHGVNNIPSANSHPEMSTVIVPSNNSSLLSKSCRERIIVEEYLDPNDQAAKGEKDVWQLAGTPDSYYHAPENSMYNDPGDIQIRHRHLSAGQQGSVIYSENGILSQQQAQVTIASAFPMDNSASFMQPCSNRESNGQLQTIAKDIGVLSYSLEHMNGIEQSTDLHSLVNNRLAQSAPLPSQQQLIDERRNSLYVQQLQKNLYSDVRFPTKGNPPIVEHHSFAASGPVDHRNNWFPEEHQSHNNWSGIESDNCLTQSLPGGSNTDGSLFSALAQYKQPSVHMQSGRSSPSQLLGIRNQVRPAWNFVPWTQDTNPQIPNIYGYTQNVPNSQGSHVASVGSLNNMQWTNFIQQNPGMPDFMSRQFRGPWTR